MARWSASLITLTLLFHYLTQNFQTFPELVSVELSSISTHSLHKSWRNSYWFKLIWCHCTLIVPHVKVKDLESHLIGYVQWTRLLPTSTIMRCHSLGCLKNKINWPISQEVKNKSSTNLMPPPLSSQVPEAFCWLYIQTILYVRVCVFRLFSFKNFWLK